MPTDELRVNPVDLLYSGRRVEWHAGDVASGHAASDTRTEAALAGWTGLSASALAAKTVEWHAAAANLVARLSDHAQDLQSGAVAYRHTEAAGARLLQPGAAADGAGLPSRRADLLL